MLGLRVSSLIGRSLFTHLPTTTSFRSSRFIYVAASNNSSSTNGTPSLMSSIPGPPQSREKHTGTNGAAFPPPPPQPTDHSPPAWTDEVWASPLDVRRRIFCNRSLSMTSIKAVGFDMDYTLASYKPDTFETLAHEQTVDKLVLYFGYPPSLYDLTFDWRYMSRGLVIDKKRGNTLKVDRHTYVKLAYHGFKPLSRDQRMDLYNAAGGQLRHEFDEPEYALIDTLFSLAEAHLFMQLVEVLDSDPENLPAGKRYEDLYRDVRGAVDLCHRDGSIKREVARNPEKYIWEDPGLVPVLEMLRTSGKKVFLATNSLWDYTSVVMNYIVDGKKGSDRDDAWLERFDAVITGCGKPRFFTERKDLFEVHPETGMLWNTEGGSPMVPIGEADLPTPLLGSTAPAHVDHRHAVDGRARVFQGGSFIDLHKMMGVKAGAEILYVGDHIYGDVLRSKKDLGWRTMLVIPELESELDTLAGCGGNMAELRVLREQRNALDDQIQRLEWSLKTAGVMFGGADDAHDEESEVEWNDRAVLNEEAVLMSELDEECEAGAGDVATAAAAPHASAGKEAPSSFKEDEKPTATSSPKSSKSASKAAPMDSAASCMSSASLSSSQESSFPDEDTAAIMALLDNLREQRDILRGRHSALLQAHHESFHKTWGQLFKTGYQNSRYAHQVERYACLYTSHVSNLVFYSPLKSYKGRLDSMAHEEESNVLRGGRESEE